MHFNQRNALACIAGCGAAMALALMLATASRAEIPVTDGGLFDRLDADGNGTLTADEVADEHQKLFARLVRLGDENDDGVLSAAEWKVAIKPHRPAKPIEEKQPADFPGAREARVMLLKLDTNGDAILTASEAPKQLKKTFEEIQSELDRNKDQRIDRQELGRGSRQLVRIARKTARQQSWNTDKELARFDKEQGEDAKRFERSGAQQFERLDNPQRARAIFRLFDTNRDGVVELSEVPDQSEPRVRRLVRLGDRNRDGKLSEREFMRIAERAFPTDDEGTMKTAESDSAKSKGRKNSDRRPGRTDARTLERRVASMFKRHDKDGDGSIAKSEAQDGLAKRFDRIDRNSDGLLDRDEVRQVQQSALERENRQKQRRRANKPTE